MFIMQHQHGNMASYAGGMHATRGAYDHSAYGSFGVYVDNIAGICVFMNKHQQQQVCS